MATTVVIPTYNEAENLPALVEALYALDLPDLRVLVVDDSSPDGTGRIAEELGERLRPAARSPSCACSTGRRSRGSGARTSRA